MPSLRTLPSDLKLFAKYHLRRRAVTYPAPETELGVASLGFDLDAHVRAVEAFAGDGYDVERLASIPYGGRAHPILAVRSRGAYDKTLLVLAGVHGNEQAGLLAVPEILARPRVEGVRRVVITPVNPVGAAQNSRYEAHGYDVNRDFVRFDTAEARVVRDVFAREPPDLVISLHEGPQDATFMFGNRFVSPALARALLDALEAGGTTLAERDYFGRRLHPRGWSPLGRGGWALQTLWGWTLGMKATLLYSDDRAIPELVLESSWRLPDRAARVRAHVDLVVAAEAALASRSASAPTRARS